MGNPITRDTHPPATAGPVEELEDDAATAAEADIDAEPARYTEPGEPLTDAGSTTE